MQQGIVSLPSGVRGKVPIEIYFYVFLIVKSGTYGENNACDTNW